MPKVALAQIAASDDREANRAAACELIREAAGRDTRRLHEGLM